MLVASHRPGFWETLSRSWALVLKSWHVLKKDRELLLLPLIGAVVSLVALAVMVFFALLLLSAGEVAMAFGLFAIYYFIAVVISEFFNAALVAGALERFGGGDPTVRSSLAKAASRLGAIIGWGLLSAAVGLIIGAIRGRQRGGLMDVMRAMTAFALFAAWRFVSFLVLPVIVAEGRGAIGSLRRSYELVRKRWGEVVAGGIGVWAAGRIVMLAIFAFFLAIGYASLELLGFSVPLLLALFLLLIASWLIAGLVFATLDKIFVAAVYLYATRGRARAFAEKEIKGILRPGYL